MKVRELVDKYLASQAFDRLSNNSKINYRTTIRKSGILDKEIKDINFEFTDNFYATVAAKRGRHAAFLSVAVFKKIWNWGFRREYTTINPWEKMDIDNPEPRDVVWTKEQIETFVRTAVELDKEWLALLVIMCYYLSQRPSDILALRWDHYRDGWLTIWQSKTDQTVHIPVPDPLRKTLDEAPFKDKYIIAKDHHGNYVKYDTAARHFKRVRKKAKLPENLTMRDLRRTGLTELGEYGLTEDQIRAISGHKTRDVLNVYVRIRDKIAEAAIKRRFGDSEGNLYDDPFYNGVNDLLSHNKSGSTKGDK